MVQGRASNEIYQRGRRQDLHRPGRSSVESTRAWYIRSATPSVDTSVDVVEETDVLRDSATGMMIRNAWGNTTKRILSGVPETQNICRLYLIPGDRLDAGTDGLAGKRPHVQASRASDDGGKTRQLEAQDYG